MRTVPGARSHLRSWLKVVALLAAVGSVAIAAYVWHVKHNMTAWQEQYVRLDATLCTLYRGHGTDSRTMIWNNAINTLTDGARNVCLYPSVSAEEMRQLEYRIGEQLSSERVTIGTVRSIRKEIVSISEAAAEYGDRHRRYADEVYQAYEEEFGSDAPIVP